MAHEGSRARSHAHGKRHGRFTVHLVVVSLALLAVAFATRFSQAQDAGAAGITPRFALSGVTGGPGGRDSTFFHPGASQQTRASMAALVAAPDVGSVRAAGAISPVSSFSSGVSSVTAATGEAGAGVKPLADIIDPLTPYVLYVAQPGDSAGLIAEKYGIKLSTLLANNPVVKGDGSLIIKDQALIVPRKDGILHKVGFGETVDKVVGQYDNITVDGVLGYRPNGVTDPKNLEAGKYLLLVGATVKPPPPPPPAPPARTNPGGTITGNGSRPAAGGSGKFSYPLARWHGVSDEFGRPRGGGTYHTGIDLDLYGMHHSNIFSACSGVVSRVEYLTYSYGYHVVVDCGGGFTTLYAHMSQINVSPGQQVGAGTILGVSGLTGYTTGEHLHFEIRLNGAYVDPADYLSF